MVGEKWERIRAFRRRAQPKAKRIRSHFSPTGLKLIILRIQGLEILAHTFEIV